MESASWKFTDEVTMALSCGPFRRVSSAAQATEVSSASLPYKRLFSTSFAETPSSSATSDATSLEMTAPPPTMMTLVMPRRLMASRAAGESSSLPVSRMGASRAPASPVALMASAKPLSVARMAVSALLNVARAMACAVSALVSPLRRVVGDALAAPAASADASAAQATPGAHVQVARHSARQAFRNRLTVLMKPSFRVVACIGTGVRYSFPVSRDRGHDAWAGGCVCPRMCLLGSEYIATGALLRHSVATCRFLVDLTGKTCVWYIDFRMRTRTFRSSPKRA